MLFYWDQFNSAQTTPNPDLLTSLSLASCKSCNAFITASNQLQDQHQRYSEAPFSVTNVLIESLTDNTATAITDVDQMPIKIVNADGATVATAAQKKQQLSATLQWASNSWKVQEIQVLT